MSTDPIQAILTDFANQIRVEVQRQALAALNDSFDGVVRPAHMRGTQLDKGAKRDPAVLDKLQGQLIAFVKQTPGLRIEQINKQLGTTTRELALPIRKAIAEGMLKTKGEKRSTQYFPGPQR